MSVSNRQYAAYTRTINTSPAFKAFVAGYVAMASRLTVSSTNPTALGLRPPRGVVIEKVIVRGIYPATVAGRNSQNRDFNRFIAQFRTLDVQARRNSGANANSVKCAAFDMGKRQAQGDFSQHSYVEDGRFLAVYTPAPLATNISKEAQILRVSCPYRSLAANIRGTRGLRDVDADPTAAIQGDTGVVADAPGEAAEPEVPETAPRAPSSDNSMLIYGLGVAAVGLLAYLLSSTNERDSGLKGLSGGPRKVYDPVAFLEKAMKRHKAGKVDDAYLQSVYHSAIYTDGLSDKSIQSLRDKLNYYPKAMAGFTRMYTK